MKKDKKELTGKDYLAKYKKNLGWFADWICPCYFFGEEIPDDTKFVVSNHLQFLDPVFALAFLDKYIRCVSKKETLEIPVIGKMAHKIGAIHIDREKEGGDLSAIKAILRAIKNNEDVMIFPEGTRNKTGTTEIQKLKEGTALFALKTGAMVLPIMIYKKHKLFRRNYLYVGKPFDFKEMSAGKKIDANLIEEANAILYEKMVEAKAFMDEYMANDGAKKIKKLYKEQRKINKKKKFVVKID